MTCGKSQEFLTQANITPGRVQDARKETIDGDHALGVLDGIDELYVAKGKNVSRVDLKKARPDDATLKSLILGPTGNLRAPAARVGRRLVIGFDPAMYSQVLEKHAKQ